MTLEENTLPFSSNKSDINGGDNDDKCSNAYPVFYMFEVPMWMYAEKKDMTVGCCSVHIDGFLDTCFMSCLGPLTHFCDWLLSE